MVATAINQIVNSGYWQNSAIIITWDDSEGDWDHLPPPVVATGPDGSVTTDGPRVPFIVMSPFSKVGYISKTYGTQVSAVRLIDEIFSTAAPSFPAKRGDRPTHRPIYDAPAKSGSAGSAGYCGPDRRLQSIAVNGAGISVARKLRGNSNGSCKLRHYAPNGQRTRMQHPRDYSNGLLHVHLWSHRWQRGVRSESGSVRLQSPARQQSGRGHSAAGAVDRSNSARCDNKWNQRRQQQ